MMNAWTSLASSNSSKRCSCGMRPATFRSQDIHFLSLSLSLSLSVSCRTDLCVMLDEDGESGAKPWRTGGVRCSWRKGAFSTSHVEESAHRLI